MANEGQLNSINNAIASLDSTTEEGLKFWAAKYKGHLSTSNITESGYAGILTKIQIQDTLQGVGNLIPDATISINIDGDGAQTLNLATMYRAGNGSLIDNLSNGVYCVGADDDVTMTLQLNIPFSTSVAVSISNADGFCIFWNEEV